MARSLGTLTLDLVARVGGFTAGLSQAEREADKRSKAISKRARDIEKAWGDVGKTIAAGFAGITIGAVFGKFIQESRDAQNEQSQLAAVLRSTGEAAGYSQEKLNGMASAMAQNSIFDDGDINKAQTRLLSYTNVVGEQFPEALQAAIDMASRLGISLEQSAETIGKALDVPSDGLTALSKQGFRFSEDQKKVIERLEQTGRTAEAQKIILDALNSSYGGAGRAARDTFGGALQGLQNQLSSLMTGDDGSLDGAASAINDLTAALGSDATKKAFSEFTAALAEIIRLLVSAGVEFLNAGDSFARGLAKITGNLSQMDELAGRIKDIDSALKNRALARSFSDMFATDQELKDARRRATEQMAILNSTYSGRYWDPRRLGDVPSIADQTAAWGNRNKKPGNVGGGGAKGKDPYAEAQRFLESLQKQLLKTRELSEVEEALAEIQSGRLGKVNDGQRQQILATAKEIDALKKLKKEREESAKRLEANNEEVQRLWKEAASAIQSVETPLETYNRKLRENTKLARDNPFITGEALERLNSKAWDEFSGSFEKINVEMEKTNDIGRELGLTFSSAFEDAIAGGKSFKDILGGIFADINRMVARELVTKPFSEAITGWTRGLLGGFGGGGGMMGPQTEQMMGDAFAKQFSQYAGGGGGGFLSGLFGKIGSFFSFDGGGHTGNGARSGGMDGRGGFMAMLHPNETVLDHTKGQGLGGPTFNITVPVSGNVDARTRSQIAATIQQQLSYASQRFT